MMDHRACPEAHPSHAENWCPACQQASSLGCVSDSCYRQADADEAENRAQEAHDWGRVVNCGTCKYEFAPLGAETDCDFCRLEPSRAAALHPHDNCPRCKDITFEELALWLVNNQTQSSQGLAEKLMKTYNLTKKEAA